MKKTIVRLFCMVFALAMIGISCISCEGRGDPEDTDAQSGTQSPGETLDPNSEEALLMPDQEPLDFDFKILANQQWYNFWHYGYDAEANGEPQSIMDRAVYERQEFLYNRYGINIVLVATDNAYSTLAQSASSGSYAIDVVALLGTNSMMAAQNGFLYDLNKIGELNLNASYYDQNIQDAYHIGDHLFQIDGAYSYVDEMRTQSVAFSVEVYNEYQLAQTYGSLYDLVRKNQWTYEVMQEMYQNIGRDVNDDGQMTDEDMFGRIGDSSDPANFMLGGGVRLLDNTGGELTLAVKPGTSAYEQMITTLQRTLTDQASPNVLSHDLNGWTEEDKAAQAANLFANGQALFRTCTFGALLRHVGSEFEFGILPCPRMYESQDRYYSACYAGGCEPLGLAVNGQPDLSRAARALEILAYHSVYIPATSSRLPVYESFFEHLTELRLCRTPEDVEMLHILFDNKIYDLDDALNVIGVKNIVGGLVRDGSYDTLVSSLQSAMGSADSQLWLIQTTIEEKCPN